jgi:hypothetical protein
MVDKSSGEATAAGTTAGANTTDGASARPSSPAYTKTTSGTELTDQFALEDSYPSAHDVFVPSCVKDVKQGDAIVVLDTNTLLVPYGIKQDDLTALQDIYRGLADAKRLFLPARVAREFIKHRDVKLADLLKALNDQKSRLKIPEKRLSPLLEGVPGYDALLTSQEGLVEARKSYDVKLTAMIDRVRSWRGDDPVTSLYRIIFTSSNIVEIDDPRDDLIHQWTLRLRNRTPPGYKDSNKDDLGIGDFIFWKTILSLGNQHGKDLVFVTGEEKADWFVRSNNDGVYPRPELVDEYRRASSGQSLSLMSLSQFLTEMQVEDDIVEEIRSVEEALSISGINKSDRRNQRIIADESINITDLRDVLREIFPSRRKGGTESILELAEELRLVGISSALEFKSLVSSVLNDAIKVELEEQGSVYFRDVGMVRECMRLIYDDYDNIIELAEKNLE